MKFCIPFMCLLLTVTVYGEGDDTEEDTTSYKTEEEILQELLFGSGVVYNPKIMPGERGISPLEVRATMYILDISSVDDFKNEFAMQFYFRQEWRDPRLAFDHLPIQPKHIRVHAFEQVWKPDSFFVQEREGKLHTIMMPNSFMRIYPDGTILYSERLSMKFSCNMDFRYFPLDTQKCSMVIESYGSTWDEIRYSWDDTKKSVGVNDQINMPDFALTDYKYFSGKVDHTTASYGHLQLELTFKRKIGLFMNKLYVPFVILVIASWLSFWIKAKFTSLRLTLILTILFIMFWLQLDVSRHIPPASYTKAVDVWTGVCLSLVFSSLLQFILVSHLAKNEKHRRKQERKIDPEALFITQGSERKLEKNSSLDSTDANAVSQLIGGILNERNQLYNKIDTFSRLFYPLIFGAFNLIYWPVYCSGN